MKRLKDQMGLEQVFARAEELSMNEKQSLTAAETKQSDFSIPQRLALFLFAIVAAGGFLDYSIGSFGLEIQDFHRYLCWGLVGLLFFTENIEKNWHPRFLHTLLIMAILLALAGFVFVYYGQTRVNGDFAFRAFVSTVVLNVSIWLAIPLLRTARSSRGGLLFVTSFVALLSYFAFQYLSCISSADGEQSFYFYLKDRACLLPVLVCWARMAIKDENFRQSSGRVIVYFLALLTVAALSFLLIDLFGTRTIQEWMVQWNIIDAPSPRLRRLTFPTMHFNRTAFWALVAAGAFGASIFSGACKRRACIALAILATISFGLVFFTYTRGVLVAAVFGIAVWALVDRHWKTLGGVAVLLSILVVLTPQQIRGHLYSIVRPETYTGAGGPHFTSMRSRLLIWNWATEAIRENSILGLGYGTEATKASYSRYVSRRGSEEAKAAWKKDPLAHTHNLFIETAVQSGLPALLALLIFFGCRITLLLRALSVSVGQQRSRMAVYLGLEGALILGSMLFFMLRRNFGFMFFYVWIWILVEAFLITLSQNKKNSPTISS